MRLHVLCLLLRVLLLTQARAVPVLRSSHPASAAAAKPVARATA
jgi:hypothetical protein